MESQRIIREPERYSKTGLSRVQWWKLEQQNRAPKRVALGPNAVGWLESEIEKWIAQRVAERDAKAKVAA